MLYANDARPRLEIDHPNIKAVELSAKYVTCYHFQCCTQRYIFIDYLARISTFFGISNRCNNMHINKDNLDFNFDLQLI